MDFRQILFGLSVRRKETYKYYLAPAPVLQHCLWENARIPQLLKCVFASSYNLIKFSYRTVWYRMSQQSIPRKNVKLALFSLALCKILCDRPRLMVFFSTQLRRDYERSQLAVPGPGEVLWQRSAEGEHAGALHRRPQDWLLLPFRAGKRQRCRLVLKLL